VCGGSGLVVVSDVSCLESRRGGNESMT
jgi:hypothetical protein